MIARTLALLQVRDELFILRGLLELLSEVAKALLLVFRTFLVEVAADVVVKGLVPVGEQQFFGVDQRHQSACPLEKGTHHFI